jgi:hypothetical protein
MKANQFKSANSLKKTALITALSIVPVYLIYSNASTEERSAPKKPIVSEANIKEKGIDLADTTAQAIVAGSEQAGLEPKNELDLGTKYSGDNTEVPYEAAEKTDEEIINEIANNKIDTDRFHNANVFNSKDIDKIIENDSDFQHNVIELVRTELAKPRDEIGQGLVGIESDEVMHARRVIRQVLDFEDKGILVDLDELTYIRFGNGMSAGIFGKSKKFARVASHTDDYGNEVLSMAAVSDETIKEPLSIKAPVSAGFIEADVSLIASSNPQWVESNYGNLQSGWAKSKIVNETDNTADYYLYERWTDARPKMPFWTYPGVPTRTYVRTGDTMSGLTYRMRQEAVKNILDWQPHRNMDMGSDTCDELTFTLSVADIIGVGVEKTFEICDITRVAQVWGGLWTRFIAKKGWYEDWSSHYGKSVNNNFAVTLKFTQSTDEEEHIPYWWDYSDAQFCYDYIDGVCFAEELSQSVL